MSRDVQYIVTDVSGRVVSLFSNKNVTEEIQTLNIERYAPGVYFVTAKTAQNTTTKRFIKK